MAPRLLARLGERGMVRWGGVLIGVGFAAWLVAPHWALSVPAALLVGFGAYLLHGTLQTHATQMAPTARGTAVSLFAFGLFGGQALGVLLAGWLVDTSGYSAPLLTAALALPLLGLAFDRALRLRETA